MGKTTRRQFLRTAAAGAAGAAGIAGAGLPPGDGLSPAHAAGTPTPNTSLMPPTAAARLVFSDDFTSASTIDINATDAPGYKWYPRKWFRRDATRPENIRVSNSVLRLGGAGGEVGLSRLSTAIAVDTSPFVRGTVFRGGFFEARIRFDYRERPPTARANPAFWSMAIEHVASQKVGTFYTQWPGQPAGYSHYIELDFMEHFSEPRRNYVCTIHDWSGPFAVPPSGGDRAFWWYDIMNGNNIVNVGPVDWNQWHTFACRWTPQNGSTPGRAQWFLDSLSGPTTNVFWRGPIGNPPLPGQAAEPGTPARTMFTPDTHAEANRTYAIIDQQRIALTLTTDPTFPMYVDWVRVWDSAVEVI